MPAFGYLGNDSEHLRICDLVLWSSPYNAVLVMIAPMTASRILYRAPGNVEALDLLQELLPSAPVSGMTLRRPLFQQDGGLASLRVSSLLCSVKNEQTGYRGQ